MELNQTSPPPTSPVMDTEGEDPCGIDVTSMALHSVMLFLCLCGLAGNGAVLWLLGFRIRRNPVTVYILNLAVADFAFLLFLVPFTVPFLLEDVSCSVTVSLDYLRSLFLLSLFSYNTGLYLLTAISVERCMSILCPLWYRCRRPQHQSGRVSALLWALSIAVMVTMTSLCLSHRQEHCRVAVISMYALSILFTPFMVISNVILFMKIMCGSKQRQPKRLYIVIFLTVFFFLTLVVPLSLCNFLQHLGHTIVPSVHSVSILLLLTCINSSINPFIYFLVGSCRRRCSLVSLQVAFQRVFEETGVSTASG